MVDKKGSPDAEIGCKMGELVGKVHAKGICHGDLTTSNFIEKNGKYYIIDFGLSSMTQTEENRAVGQSAEILSLYNIANKHI